MLPFTELAAVPEPQPKDTPSLIESGVYGVSGLRPTTTILLLVRVTSDEIVGDGQLTSFDTNVPTDP